MEGSPTRFSVLAALAISLATSVAAHADTSKKGLARELFELGIEEYKSKQYEAAAASMAKSFALDPQPDALYAEAQSERLAGDCIDASVHYTKLLELAKDDSTSTAVKANLQLCTQIERGEKPKEDPNIDAQAKERRDAPTVQIRTVYRTERHTDKLAIALYSIGGIALGGAAVTYLVADSTRSDANSQTTLVEYNKLFDRSVALREASYIAAGAGLVLVGYATFRVLHGSSTTRVAEKLAFVPTPGGTFVAWHGSW